MKLGIIIFIFSLPTLAQNLEFKDRGKTVETISRSDFDKLSKKENVVVHEPHELADVGFEAYPLKPILNHVYGPHWTKRDELLLTCADGYQPSIAVERFARLEPYIAVGRKGAAFEIIEKNNQNKKASLGPYYLIWIDPKDQSFKESDDGAWPFQLVAFDIIDFAEKFPGLAPPAKSSAAVKRGFAAFRKNCFSCHSINGEGGIAGPELNYPVNITEYYNEKYLHRWIDNPTSIRFRTSMPPLNPAAPDRAKTIDDIIAYFKAMKTRKVKPAKL